MGKMTNIVEQYHRNLPTRIRNWLKKERGLSDEIITKFKLGWNGKAITIPITNSEGQYSFFKYRKDPEDNSDSPRYWYDQGASAELYGCEHIVNPPPTLIVSEGELDRLILESHGIPAITSTGGAGTFKDEWVEELRKLSSQLFIALDNDTPGCKGAQQLAEKLPKARVVGIPILDGVKDITDFIRRQGIEEFRKLLQTARTLSEIEKETPPLEKELQCNKQNGESEGRGRTQASKLISLAKKNINLFFHDTTQTPFVRIQVGSHSEIWPCRSSNFKRWLALKFWEMEVSAPNPEALTSALNVLEGYAGFDGTPYKLYNRVAEDKGAFWYDLSDKEWRAVKITPDGWEIISEPPLLFRRYSHQAGQVEPEQGGKLTDILKFTNLKKEDQILFLVYLVSCFIPDIPHPIPILHGEKGSAKTSLFRVLRQLIDPSAVEVLSFPHETNETIQKLSHHWMSLFDNVSYLPDWIANILCRAVTGEGFSKRQLYSDDDDVIYSFRRCVGLNGINIAATQPDLLDRAILFRLEQITPAERREEREFWEAFNNKRPFILGGVFDILSQAMRIYPSVKLNGLNRMADFTRWGYAIAEALGYDGQAFLRAYGRNIATQIEECLEASPVAIAIRGLMNEQIEWEGAPADLYSVLESKTDALGINIKGKDWPQSVVWLSRRLNEIRSNLRAVGIEIDMRHEKKRWITIHKVEENTVDTDDTDESHAEQGFPDASNTVSKKEIPLIANPLLNKDCDSNDGNDSKILSF